MQIKNSPELNQKTRRSNAILKRIFFALVLTATLCWIGTVRGATVDDLSQKISDIQTQINQKKAEISQLSNVLDSTSKQANTLKSALAALELTQKKLQANLDLTSKQISKTSLTLSQLSSDIAKTEIKIASSSAAISENIREVQMSESESLIEQLLAHKSVSDAWDYVNALNSVQGKIKTQLEDLHDSRDLLGAKHDQVTGEKSKLESYRKTLADQQKVAASTKASKDALLKDTQNKESNYRTLLAQKMAEEAEYEKELFNYESQLKVTINPNEIPTARQGILTWPVTNISVTQFFGKSVSAKRLYTSGTHNGIDLRASIGTPIMAALSGTVMDTEPTRYKSGCQYGKYVLIKHPNGLSTIYGHLSQVSVKPGDTVITGDVIGYSGDTGYATGPHLHLGLYVTAGIKIVDSSSLGSTRCAGIKTVAAPPSAYLDPMAYLPAI